MAQVKVTQLRSANGSSRRQRETLRSLGLGKIGRSIEREEGPALLGALHAVRHLVKVER